MGVYYAMPMSDAVESYLRVPDAGFAILVYNKKETRKKEITSPCSLMVSRMRVLWISMNPYYLDGQKPERGASSKKRNMNRVMTRIRAPSLLEKRRGKEVKHAQSPSETPLSYAHLASSSNSEHSNRSAEIAAVIRVKSHALAVLHNHVCASLGAYSKQIDVA